MEDENLETIRRDFSESTSCHGIGQMYASKSKCQRGFWCFLVLTVFGILGSQNQTKTRPTGFETQPSESTTMADLPTPHKPRGADGTRTQTTEKVTLVTIRIQAYLARKTTTSITEKYNTTLEMPAITICNFNSFFNITTNAENDAITEVAKAKFDTFDNMNYLNVEYFDEAYNGSIRQFAINKGWDLTESLNWCRFGNEECFAKNFTYTIGEMGKCWTYNAPRPVEKAGSKNGIYMVFDVQQDQYSESYKYGRWEAGIKVQIHSNTNVPEVDELGLAVPVGSMAFITVKMIEENRMYQPWGECLPNNEKLDFSSTYSRANCFHECYMAALAEECKCRLYYFEEPKNLRECRPQETLDCLQFSTELLKPFLTPERCGCQPPCHDVRYDTKISYGAFPNVAIQDAATDYWSNMTTEYMTRNFVGFHVYHETLTYTKRQEDKQITWSALLSDLGGQLGLWIGISVVTIFEFGQFVGSHLRALVRTIKHDRKETKEASTVP